MVWKQRGVGMLSALIGASAMAGPVAHDGSESFVGPAGPETPSIGPSETATMSFRATNQNVGDLGFYNSEGDVPVTIGAGLTSLGSNPDGVDILGSWAESSLGDTRRRVRAVWQTADGSALLPFGTEINGRPVQFLRWNFGVSDLVEWTERVIDIDLVSATFFGSFNSGQTFADIEPIGALFDNGISQWTLAGGFDRGDNLISDTAGPSGYNFVMTEYVYDVEFDPIPTPGTLAVLVGAGLVGVRRRR